MHPPEHLCKNAKCMVKHGFQQVVKAALKAKTSTIKIQKTLTNQHFHRILKGRQPRIEIDVLLWKMLIFLIQSGVGAL